MKELFGRSGSTEAFVQSKLLRAACNLAWSAGESLLYSVSLSGTVNPPALAASVTDVELHLAAGFGAATLPVGALLGVADPVVLGLAFAEADGAAEVFGLPSGVALATAPECDGAGEPAFAPAGDELFDEGAVEPEPLEVPDEPGVALPFGAVAAVPQVTTTGGATTPRKFSTAAAPSCWTSVASWPGMSTTSWLLPWMATVAWVTPVPLTRSARIWRASVMLDA